MTDPTWDLGTAALRGAARWSDVYLPEELWGEYALAAIDVRSPSEVYIAIAIREGIAGATEAFELMYFSVIDRALDRAGATAEEVVELTELMREWLFETRTGQQPVLAAYAGHGQLVTLLRTAVLRAFDDLRGEERQAA